MTVLDLTLKKLAEDAEPVSVASLYALSGLDRADLARVNQLWPSIPLDRRQSAMRHLVEIADANFEVDFNSIYRLGLSDQDPIVRAAAIEGLWEDNDPDLIAPFIQLLQSDEAESVRAAAASALGRYVLAGELEEIEPLKAKPVLEALRASLAQEAESLEVRRRALEAIGFWSDTEADQLIRQGYAHPHERMRISAVFAMGRSADTQWGEIILAELESPNPEMRFEAARASGELEYLPAVRALSRLTEDVDDEVQKAAVYSLGQIGGDAARQALIKVLESDYEYLHDIAEDALDELEFKSGNLDFTLLAVDGPDVELEEDDEWTLDLLGDEDEEDDDTVLDD
jgi:hypothetical protein